MRELPRKPYHGPELELVVQGIPLEFHLDDPALVGVLGAV
jgi:hypothetical protein